LPAFSFEESFWTEQELFIAPDDEVRAALRDTAFLRLEDETIHIVERSTQRTVVKMPFKLGTASKRITSMIPIAITISIKVNRPDLASINVNALSRKSQQGVWLPQPCRNVQKGESGSRLPRVVRLNSQGSAKKTQEERQQPAI